MKRRELIVLLGGPVLLWPLAAGAEQKATSVIGFLSTGSPDLPVSYIAAFHRGLGETGYVEGQNLKIEYRWAEERYDRLPALAAELAGHKVDLILSWGGLDGTRAAKNATSTIPIVFIGLSDPVRQGLVASLARPGGNLTGFTIANAQLVPKRLELLTELVPQAGVITLLVNPKNAFTESVIRDAQEAARAKGVQLSILRASTESEIDAALDSLAQQQVGALIIAGDSLLFSRREQLVGLASRHSVPAIYTSREAALAGGLISYGTNYTNDFRAAGIYSGRILNGEKPADLPVQQPTTFELVINLKTAKALGLTVPQTLLARADEVIE